MANLSDEHLILLEHTVRANEQVLEENRRLREQLAERDETHNKVMRDVLGELQQLRQQEKRTSNSRCRRGRKEKQNIQIPPLCRVSTSQLFEKMWGQMCLAKLVLL